MEIMKELVFYAGMCGLYCLQKAAASVLVKKLSKQNVSEIFEILSKNKIESEDALNFVIGNFEKSELLQKEIHKKFPEVAVAVLENEAEMRAAEKTFVLQIASLKCFNNGPNGNISKTGSSVQIFPNYSLNNSIQFQFCPKHENEFLIHGIGLSLLHGSNVKVNVELWNHFLDYDEYDTYDNYDDYENFDNYSHRIPRKELAYSASKQVLVPVSKCTRIIPIEFSKPLRLTNVEKSQIDVSVTGNGSARTFPNDQITSSFTGKLLDESVRGREIEIPFQVWIKTPKTIPHIIAEIYFEMCE